MRLILTGRNLDVSPPLRQLVERKLSKLERMLNDSALSCQTVLTQQKHRHVAEITIHARGDHMLHGLGSGAAWPIAIRQAIDKIVAQAQTLKGKWNTRKRRALPTSAVAPRARRGPAPPEPAHAAPRIIRATRYPVKPMDL
jgi:putative sigma-54 modulation protein